MFFFYNDTATTEIYTLSLHERSSDLGHPDHRDAAAELRARAADPTALLELGDDVREPGERGVGPRGQRAHRGGEPVLLGEDRKSTRLNSSHANISYAVFCLKKKRQRA